jgi:RNA polymerase sigma-70 factor (ECF subfamily)
MHDTDWLAQRFEEHRDRLTAVAYRMLGSAGEADDAVQEAWIRLSRSDAEAIENLGGWLTTVVSRVCLNVLQARRARLQVPLEDDAAEPTAMAEDPEHEALLAETVGLALLVVLDALTPAERVAFVLHDMFGVPFEEIGPIVGRTTPATRQLASRARRRVRREDPEHAAGSAGAGHREIVDAFRAAARDGEFERLLALLDPDVVLRADPAVVALGATPETRGAAGVGGFVRRARGATPALLDGVAALVWLVAGRPRVVFRFTTAGGRITAIDLIGDPARVDGLDLVIAGEA